MLIDRVGFIGAGHIAEAMIRGLITSGYVDPGHITISEASQERADAVNRMLGAAIADSNAENARHAVLLFLTVKPQHVHGVCREIASELSPETIVVSVAAGKSLSGIKEALGGHRLTCRIMPNLTVGVRRSIIGLYADPELDEGAMRPVFMALSHLGKVFRIPEERLMAVVTALSGSAPAYYVMMADALIQYGVSQGMDKALATDMILGTLEGSAAWAAAARVSLTDLWKRVVTPGGTTQAGISFYEEKGFLDIFVEGLDRATRRARELGDE